MKFDRQKSSGYLINHLARLFGQALRRRLEGEGVGVGQFPVLLALWEAEGATQTALAERLAIEQPTMANTLKRMERDGLIERVPDPEDRRQARVHLTPRARALEAVLTGAARAANEAALAGLGPEEREQFLALVRRVIANLEQDNEGRR